MEMTSTSCGVPVGEPSPAVVENKTRRNFNFSEEEKMAIIMFVKEHKAQLLGKAGRPGHGDDKVEERKAAAWRVCTERVNQVGGNERSWKKVKKQWQAIQDKAKKCKENMQRTGGGPAPKITTVTSLAMEVMAREALDGIRSVETELDPTGATQPVLSQDSSQEIDVAPTSLSSAFTTMTTSTLTPSIVTALQQRVSQLESDIHNLTSSKQTALEKQSEVRQLKFQEEILKLEKKKVDLQQQTLDIQRKMLEVFESAGARAILNSMSEQ